MSYSRQQVIVKLVRQPLKAQSMISVAVVRLNQSFLVEEKQTIIALCIYEERQRNIWELQKHAQERVTKQFQFSSNITELKNW